MSALNLPGLPQAEWEEVCKVLKWLFDMQTNERTSLEQYRELDSRAREIAESLTRIRNKDWLNHLLGVHVLPALIRKRNESIYSHSFRRIKGQIWTNYAHWLIRTALTPGRKRSNQEYMGILVQCQALHSFQPKKMRILVHRLAMA